MSDEIRKEDLEWIDHIIKENEGQKNKVSNDKV